MSFRISSDAAKANYVIVAWVVSIFVGISAAVVAGFPAATAVWAVVFLAVVSFAVRNFRGVGEPVEPPRAWWRMTAAPASGFFFGAVFLIQALYLAVSWAADPGVSSFLIIAILNLVVGSLFLNSSIRLGRVQPS